MKLIFFILFTSSSFYIKAQDGNALIRQAEKRELSMDDYGALLKYKEALNTDPSNIHLLCKCSELCSMIGVRLSNDKLKQEDYFAASKTYASTAIRLGPNNSDANFVMALVLGRDAMRKGAKDKIEAVKGIKKYGDLSVKYDPQNYKGWYVLGKWYYEVSSLNYFEITAVKIFYGGLPTATIEDAIDCFEKVKSLAPDFILNYLSLAKAYKKKDQESMAKQNITIMISLPDKTQDDEKIKTEGRVLLKKWE